MIKLTKNETYRMMAVNQSTEFLRGAPYQRTPDHINMK
jgi:hypothetical protein